MKNMSLRVVMTHSEKRFGTDSVPLSHLKTFEQRLTYARYTVRKRSVDAFSIERVSVEDESNVDEDELKRPQVVGSNVMYLSLFWKQTDVVLIVSKGLLS
jgi:RecA/RadA recombinase